mmetsp:Transcript_127544/g.355047  ORF Transcript_127544/g.355047 Transcript_127544/m.355047 type:complete len:193 (-) Transcript_127544:269-847(-)
MACPSFIVKTSSVPGAGLGLFAGHDIPAYTILGEYKGVRRSYRELDNKMKQTRVNDLYPFWVSPGMVIDPTNQDGLLEPESQSMAFVNEAPCGQKYNTFAVYTRGCANSGVEVEPKVVYVAKDHLKAGSELFVCYSYDMFREYDIEPPDCAGDKASRIRLDAMHPGLYEVGFDQNLYVDGRWWACTVQRYGL